MRYLVSGVVGACAAIAAVSPAAQTSLIPPQPGHVKVTVEFRQTARSGESGISAQGIGPGGTVIQVDPPGVTGSARIQVQETQRTVRRSFGSFLIIQDGGEGHLTVAENVPEVVWYQQYALAHHYIGTAVMFRQVGTAFSVRPSILPGKRIRLKVTPRISYYSDGGAGTIELVEASTEVTVQSGQPISIGGSGGGSEVVRQFLLGYERVNRTGQVSIVLTGETP